MSSTEELLKSVLGVSIDAGTLRLALTHRSYAYENGGIPTNERLEFLGDSILGFSVTDALYRDNPDLPEGDPGQAPLRRREHTRALAGSAAASGWGSTSTSARARNSPRARTRPPSWRTPWRR